MKMLIPKFFIIILIGFCNLSLAHGEVTHDLKQTTLCIDKDSVLISFSHVEETRASKVKPRMLNALKGVLRRTLNRSKVNARFLRSCEGSNSFVLILVRVTDLDGLDSNIRSRYGYGPKPVGYFLSIMVGEKEEANYFTNHHMLPRPLFVDYEEIAYSEIESRLEFDKHIVNRASSLLEHLTEAWEKDN